MEGDLRCAQRHVLLQDHGIDTIGQRRTGEDADGLTCGHRAFIGQPGGSAPRHQGQHMRTLSNWPGKTIAIHGRIGQRRV